IAGALAGAGILCKQDYGLGVTGALGLFLLVQPALRGTAADEPGFGNRQPAARESRIAYVLPALQFTLGLMVALVPALAALAWAGALRDLVQQTMVMPLRVIEAAQYPHLPSLRPLLRQNPQIRAQLDSYLPSIL